MVLDCRIRAGFYYQKILPKEGDTIGVRDNKKVLAVYSVQNCPYVFVALSDKHIGIVGPCKVGSNYNVKNPDGDVRFIELKSPLDTNKDYTVNLFLLNSNFRHLCRTTISFAYKKEIWTNRLWFALDNDGARYIVIVP